LIQSETLDLLEWQRLCKHLSTFAATKLGVLAAQHLSPNKTPEASRTLLTQTQEVVELETRLTGGLSFEGITDFGEALERAERQGSLTGEELLNIATTLAGMRRLRRVLDEQDEIPVLTALIAPVRTYPELEREIHHCIDDRAKVATRASQKLESIRTRMKDVRDRVIEKLQNIMQQKSSAIQQPNITRRSDRFVIPVKAPQKEAIKGIVHDSSSTGSTLYIEPHSIVEWGNQLRTLQRQEEAEEAAILRKLTEQVAEVKEDLEELLAIATQLDLAVARGRYSLWLEANPPRFVEPTEGQNVILRELRHPLLVWQHQHEQGGEVVPINVQIQPSIRVVAITGPNTGGKTVTLKTLGLAALMAKVGLFIPAKAPVDIPWFEWVLADIGDEQSIEQSLSTFSSHITRISRILDVVGDSGLSPSLVLLDEVGAGTDPAEGSALAESLLKFLRDRVLLTIATTHYGELKALKYQDEGFENASVEFDERTLQPTYRLLWGIPGRSNALTIAKRLGLPEPIVNKAQERVGGFSEDVNEVIAGLEAQRKQQETKAQEASQLLERAEKFYQEVSQRAAELQEQERSLKASQEQQVNAEIARAKGEIAKVIRQLQQGDQTAQKAQKATETLDEISEHHLPKPQKPKGYVPKVGEQVRIPKINQTAEILKVSDDREVTVRAKMMNRNMEMTFPWEDIESLSGEKVETPPPPQEKPKAKPARQPTQASPPPPAMRTSRNTLDIRGSRVHNAERELDGAIASAIAADLNTLWIIHGKGTGKLRQGVHDYLKQHPQVAKFELAPRNEGGSGVTVANLV
jgi:DNA mismatch repair protein MutS2